MDAHAHAHEEHPPSLGRLVAVWVGLCILTIITFMTWRANLSEALALPVALTIATTKASLVILFFMELWDHKGGPRFVLAISLVFIALLAFFTIMDVKTRFPLARPSVANSPAEMHGRPLPHEE
jgi:cytochrome c oxidase subunit 4